MKKFLSMILVLSACASLLCACKEADTGTSADAVTDAPTEDVTQAPARDYYTYEDYAADPALFVPAWKGQWDVPEGMLDFEEKWNTFFTPDGRMMSVGHRGDRNIYYPENSLEGIMSAVYAGVDIVEIDVHKTRDNVVILMHDTDLLGTTNLVYKRLNGEDTGLPESNTINDWTLEELRELRLTMGNGGAETNYVIATLDDVIAFCKDKCFITLDDKKKELDWNMDVFTLIKAHEAYRTVMPPYNYGERSGYDVVQLINKTLCNNGGMEQAPFMTICRLTKDAITKATDIISEYGLPLALRSGEYDPNNLDAYSDVLGKYRIYMETLSSANDKPEIWEEMDALGFNIILSNNKSYDLIKFVQSKYFS